MVQIRQATLEDIAEITTVYRDTINHLSLKHYSEKQIKAWASAAEDVDEWEKRINTSYFIIAEIKTDIVGFAYLKNGNYFEGLYVHKDHLRQGVGSKLLRIIESKVMTNDFEVIKSEVYKTALPFFDNKYYEVIKRQNKSFKGVGFESFLMEKTF